MKEIPIPTLIPNAQHTIDVSTSASVVNGNADTFPNNQAIMSTRSIQATRRNNSELQIATNSLNDVANTNQSQSNDALPMQANRQGSSVLQVTPTTSTITSAPCDSNDFPSTSNTQANKIVCDTTDSGQVVQQECDSIECDTLDEFLVVQEDELTGDAIEVIPRFFSIQSNIFVFI